MSAKVEKARAAVERLANTQMDLSLSEWSELSASILSALEPAPQAVTITDEMVDRVLDAAGDYMGVQYGNTALHHPSDRGRIKAALMEAKS